ncbi:hypothetical protein TTHERM_00299880 (macronuclear) [Tetrahymena thermophila SB210]|uniref:Uncharacterized protein n=1 Tax=Tetrahymena thermophila (strain SB210) TaxID=312017 RepID=I7MM68_TETTS|nr:hypothetical protein TTHERM_00299880 [Tetrahymena thermophila SB210]EAS04270.1 hypothetical protein TTHERM_00299880 [Tetrahymena thermophila SB210]|eukprot:XP_001024515.1 hypothetical protein TTHERM_00299880 [Tetrahymena thermophila SB210]
MGCVNDKQGQRSPKHANPLDSKPFLQESSQLLKEYLRIEQELFKQRVHLNNLISSQRKQEMTLNNMSLPRGSSLNEKQGEWAEQTYFQEMQLLSELEKKALAQPAHYQILIEKINRVRSNFSRLVKQLNQIKTAHMKLMSMGQKYGVQNQGDFEIAYNELKKQEEKFSAYFDRNQTRNKISLSETTQATNFNN